jgi:hypothetical protein
MHKFLALVILTAVFNLFSLSTFSAAVKKAPAIEKVDTSKITVQKFDVRALEKYKRDKDFNYGGEATGQPSFWDLFWNWLWDLLFGWIGKSAYGGAVIKYFLLGLSVAILVYIVFKSFGIDPVQLWRGQAQRVAVPYSESLENIHEINFDEEIEKAVSQHNYRLAVRLLYLKCLKQLSDTNLIQWQIDKTNSAYVYELSDPKQKQMFGLLTRQFEYVWYGDFHIDQQAFSNINGLFQNFKKDLL